jgi:hypothetical protein
MIQCFAFYTRLTDFHEKIFDKIQLGMVIALLSRAQSRDACEKIMGNKKGLSNYLFLRH